MVLLICIDLRYLHDIMIFDINRCLMRSLDKKVLEVAPPAPGEDIPSGRSLLQRVEIAALTWRAGEARKSAMNDSQW